jgi:hypothetical protein
MIKYLNFGQKKHQRGQYSNEVWGAILFVLRATIIQALGMEAALLTGAMRAYWYYSELGASRLYITLAIRTL